LLSSGAFSILGWSGIASAQDQSATTFRDIYGMPNYRSPSPNLKLLTHAQDNRVTVPRDLKLFEAYLDRLPVLREVQSGIGPDLYHLMQWNGFALDMTALDHTTNQPPGTDPLYAEQVGPHRTSWSLAIVHLAIFEATNTIYQRATSYKDLQPKIVAAVKTPLAGITPLTASVRAAMAAAARYTLLRIYPKKSVYTELFEKKLVPLIGDSPAMLTLGTNIGEEAAKAVLAERGYDEKTGNFSDGSQSDGAGGMRTKGVNNSLDLEPQIASVFPTPGPMDWSADPITVVPVTKPSKALGGYWHDCRPFALDPAELFLPGPPPAPDSQRFLDSYRDVRRLGGDPNPVGLGKRRKTPTTRTGARVPPQQPAPLDDANQTFMGNFWAYDATALLCAPPRLYNMIATRIALNEHKISEVAEMARYLAIVNISLADAGVAAWTAKYKYHLGRPVTYLRNAKPDDRSDGIDNRDWTPLGAPVSNGTPDGANLTPPFPSYPSGHAVFGAALFQTLRRFHGTTPATEKFEFVSDEYNGINRGPLGEARSRVVRTLKDFGFAEAENARSRIYLGIHWQFDADEGIDQGHKVANHVMDNFFKTV